MENRLQPARLTWAPPQGQYSPVLQFRIRNRLKPGLHTQKQSVAPDVFDVGDAFIDLVDGEGGAEFEDFDVVRFDAGFERGEINIA